MKKLVRVGAATIGGVVACFTILFGPAGIVHGTAPQTVEPAQPSAVATPPPATAPPATAAPTAAPTQPPTPPPPTTPPYYQVVQAQCGDYPDDEALAERLSEAKGSGGSSHLVSMAKYCGVLFADQAEVDPEVNRPRSNLEYAVFGGDDPVFTATYDDVTANDAQIMIVVEVSTEKWNELHPPPPTTAAPAASTPGSVASTVPVSSVDAAPSTSLSSVPTATTAPTGDGEDQGGGSDTVQIMGLLLLGAGAVSWGIYGVRNDTSSDD